MNDKICFECGFDLVPKGGENRIMVYNKNVEYVLPSDFMIPTCVNCEADFMSEELEKSAKLIYSSSIVKPT